MSASYEPGGRHAKYVGPLLEALRSLGGSATPQEATSKVIEQMRIPAQELAKTHKSGESVVKNDIAWARNTLRCAGLIDNSKRGIWTLTKMGLTARPTIEQAREWIRAESAEYAARRKATKELEAASITAPGEPPLPIPPDSVEGEDLLSVLKSLSPAGFERLSQLILREAGFSEVVVTAKSGDGGIDGHGILQVNELVSFRVLFQCKRYKDSVSAGLIRDFRGAMQGRTDKGIFITTGSFTADAERESVRDGAPPIELVDGARLVKLMERLGLGVKPRTVFDVDHKFFETYR